MCSSPVAASLVKTKASGSRLERDLETTLFPEESVTRVFYSFIWHRFYFAALKF